MQKLEIILNEIEKNIEFHELVNEKVSKVPTGWHLEHLMLVINNVIFSIEKSNPSDYRFNYKPVRFIIMTAGKMPRGKGRAPKGVQPSEDEKRTIESLRAQFEKTRISVAKLATLNKNQFFPHPYFGNMKLKSTIKFLGIHSNHHLDIVKDIIRP